jgi:ankyrin repeat protein
MASINKQLYSLVINKGKTVDIEKLIRDGADVNAVTSDLDWTPLYAAVFFSRPATVETLLRSGARPDEKVRGSTALHLATEHARVDLISILLRFGASIDITNNDGRTALDTAIPDVASLIRNLAVAEWRFPKSQRVYKD